MASIFKRYNRHKRYRQNRGEETNFDKIGRVAAGTAGVIGAAAFLYPRGLRRDLTNALSIGLSKLSYSLDSAATAYRKKRPVDITYRSMRHIANDFVDNMKRTDIIDKSMPNLNKVSDGSAASLFQGLRGLRKMTSEAFNAKFQMSSVSALQELYGKSDIDQDFIAKLHGDINKAYSRYAMPNRSADRIAALKEVEDAYRKRLSLSGVTIKENDFSDIIARAKEVNDFIISGYNPESFKGFDANLPSNIRKLLRENGYNHSKVLTYANNIIDKMEDDLFWKIVSEESLSKFNRENTKGFKNFLDGHAATTKEIIDLYRGQSDDEVPQSVRAAREVYDRILKERNNTSLSADRRSMLQRQLDSFNDTLFDGDNIRVIDKDDGTKEFINVSPVDDIIKAGHNVLNETILGKILKTRDASNVSHKAISLKRAGSFDPILAKIEGLSTTRINRSYINANGNFYEIGDDFSIRERTDLDKYHFQEIGDVGSQAKVLRKIAGADSYVERDDHGFFDRKKSALQNPLEEALSYFTKFTDERYAPNLYTRTAGNTEDLYMASRAYRNYAEQVFNTDPLNAARQFDESWTDVDKEILTEKYKDLQDLTRFVKENTRHISSEVLAAISDNKRIFDDDNAIRLLQMSDSDLLAAVSSDDFYDSVQSRDLKTMIGFYRNDPQAFMSQKHIVRGRGIGEDTDVVSSSETLRKFIAVEFFQRRSYVNVDEAISSSSLSESAKQELRDLNILAAITQRKTDLYTDKPSDVLKAFRRSEHAPYVDMATSLFDTYENLYQSDTLVNDLGYFVQDKTSIFQRGFNNKTFMPETDFEGTVSIPKAVSVLDILRANNGAIMDETGESMMIRFFKQFNAGFDNFDNYTSVSHIPYFFVDRLISPFEKYGLGFSNKSGRNAVNLAESLFFKRILPIVGAIGAYSYINDTLQEYTGGNINTIALSGFANLDLGFRSFADTVGLTGQLKNQYKFNPLVEYWSNGTPFQSREEREEYYQNGYDPVRSGRYWSFGSSSEYRGGKIQYYQPNLLRRVTSDYYDISLYGSHDGKWSHSYIPTPTHPIAPIKALLDPYWLEKKHYYDRPYPVTGKLFDENTPWGVILNPTVGEILKPQRNMHHDVLQGTMTDVRSLIALRNEEIMSKANSSVLKISDGEASIVQEYREGAQYGDTRAYAQYVNEVPLYNDGSPIVGNVNYQDGVPVGNTIIPYSSISATSDPDGLNIYDSIQIASSSNPVAAAASIALPLQQLSEMNESIRDRARNNNGQSMYGTYGSLENYVANASVNTAYTDRGQFDPTGSKIDKDVFLDTRSIEEWLSDASYSAKELSGIYGFGIDLIMPPEKRYKLAQAGSMNSFSSRFWDASMGGIGGSFMEIARRFFPHDNHNVERINNIMNTMPAWIPERYRYGDPYAAVPKGEARLPGAGYEALNELHPDETGMYGAFDKMKILADVAPWSAEYKYWKKEAKKLVQDPVLKAEMKDIEYRAAQQQKRHDFFNYNYLHTNIEEENVIISEVGDSYFKVYGSEKKYSLAGIENVNGLNQVLSAGISVRMKYDKYDSDKTTKAILFDHSGNINKSFIDQGIYNEIFDTETAIDRQAQVEERDVFAGKIFEAIAHAPIPFIHNKFMRIDSPVESWEENELYGTSYSTWQHPIEGFIKPALRKTMAMDTPQAITNIALFGISKALDSPYENIINKTFDNIVDDKFKGIAKTAIKGATAFTNPAAFAGGVTGFMTTLSKRNIAKGVEIGEAIGLAALAYQKADNPLIATGAGAAIGFTYGAKFFETSNKKAAAVGALAGLAISAMKNPSFDYQKMFGEYIPESATEKFELQEYFDRLRYIKYTGLYEAAARQAKRHEGVDIKSILTRLEEREAEKEQLKEKLFKQRNSLSNNIFIENDARNAILRNINSRLQELDQQEDIAIPAGEYTQAALAYKKAAESTIYGLDKDASWSEILRALPSNHRDYFIEFGKENDPEKRKKIRELVPEYEQKVLDILWGEGDPEQPVSNFRYFANHYLPSATWSGWSPRVSLDNVQIKTIKNEGMLLSDFGYYDSQASSLEMKSTPGINNYTNPTQSPIALRANLMSALNGFGLYGVDVSLAPSLGSGISMVANVARVSSYEIKNKLNGILGQQFYS